MQDIFLPFTIDKRFWNKNLPIVFLNKVYERQIDDDDVGIHYETLITCHHKNLQRCEPFIMSMVNALGKILNQYHDLDECDEFWKKVLYFWVQEYVCSMRFKIDQLNNLKKEYPPDLYSYHTYAGRSWKRFDLFSLEDSHNAIFFAEAYHYVSYLWLAERFYDIHIEEVDLEIKEINSPMVKKEFILDILRNIRDELISFTNIFPSCMRVGTFGALEGRFSWIKWFFWSNGAIRRLLIPEVQCSAIIDLNFRSQLKERLLEEIKITREEEMILDFLPQVFPRFFVEEFKIQYEAASKFLEKHPNLSVIYTSTSIIGKSVQKICMLLLQKRGGKVLGQQHGSAYNVTRLCIDFLHELELNDSFYFWGRAVPQEIEGMHTISSAPSWKLERHNIFKSVKPASDFLLYVTTGIEAYPRSYHYGFVDQECEEYLELELLFLRALRKEIRDRICLRPFPRDFGWHMSKQLSKTFPKMKVDSKSLFDKLLEQCSLFIVDHISTTWLEALYINKPMIVFTTQHSSVTDHEFWDTEKPYFNMLEEAGIVFYSPEKAAAQVNRIMDEGIMNWWMDQKRQQVLQTLRERWTTKVENIDKWWYHELMSQARTVE